LTPSQHRDTTREMLFGICITLALFAGASVVPVLGLIGIFVLPLPILVYRLKLGRARGAVIPAAAFAVMALMLGGGSLDLFLFLALLLLGFILGESLERNFSLEKTVVVACGGLTLAGLFILFFYSRMAGVGIPDIVSKYVADNLSLYQAAADKMGVSEETRQALSASVEWVKFYFVRVLPGVAISGMLFMAWITLLLARTVLKRLGLPYPNFGELVRWRAPEMLVWGVIGCGSLLLIPAAGLKLIGINGLMVVMQIYFFQGIAIVAFFFEKKRVPLVIRWGLYTLMSLQVFFLLMVIGLGFFDIWLNLRKLGADNGTEP
jgi:uncharacterized protein YybS (DUF2232 family)